MTLIPYVAGLDTVANVLTLSLFHIYSDPDLLRRLREEAGPVVALGMPAERLHDLKVLQATILETMRLHPIANVLTRYATEDFEFGGYTIAKGEKLMMALMASQRDEALFADPYVYDVDRFLEPRHEHLRQGALSPYSAGSHTCLGAGLAEVLLSVLICRIVTSDALTVSPAGVRMKPFRMSELTLDSRFVLRRRDVAGAAGAQPGTRGGR